MEQALYAAEILYILALAFSKLATLQLISVLSPARSHRRTCQAVSGFTVVWAVGAVFVIALRCGLPILWRSVAGNQCGHLVRHFYCSGTSIINGCAVRSMGCRRGNQSPHRMPDTRNCCGDDSDLADAAQEESQSHARILSPIAVSFSHHGRRPFANEYSVIIPTTLRLLYFQTPSEANDYSLGATGLVIATQCAMHYSVMSASFSYLQPFLAAFDSNLGASTKLDTVVATRSSERRKGTGASISRGHTTASVQRNAEPSHLTKRPSSEDSKAPIIMKTTSYRVEVEA